MWRETADGTDATAPSSTAGETLIGNGSKVWIVDYGPRLLQRGGPWPVRLGIPEA
jgi:hypothetical protein